MMFTYHTIFSNAASQIIKFYYRATPTTLTIEGVSIS